MSFGSVTGSSSFGDTVAVRFVGYVRHMTNPGNAAQILTKHLGCNRKYWLRFLRLGRDPRRRLTIPWHCTDGARVWYDLFDLYAFIARKGSLSFTPNPERDIWSPSLTMASCHIDFEDGCRPIVGLVLDEWQGFLSVAGARELARELLSAADTCEKDQVGDTVKARLIALAEVHSIVQAPGELRPG